MKKKHGFTLVEILIVISMMSILATILVINGVAYREKAKNLKAINTAKQIKEIVMSSYSTNGGSFNTADISSTIRNFTALNNFDESNIIRIIDNRIEIAFLSDKSNYTINLNVSTNVCELKTGSKEILNDTE